MQAPTPEETRSVLAELDERRHKIVVALFGLMVQNPSSVRDREWISRQLAEVVVLAGDFEADSAAAGVRAVEEYLHENAEPLLRAAYLLFQRVGLDLAPRVAEGFGFEHAMQLALGYLPPGE